MQTLLSWKATCVRNYIDVADELRYSLRHSLTEFVPSPGALLSLITRTRALISGEFAIEYLLRDNAFVSKTLDIYVGSVVFDSFIHDFGRDRRLSGYQLSASLNAYADPYSYTRQVTQYFEVHLSTNKTIYVHSSSTASASHAIACSPSSISSTFITEFCFATAYPRLTLNNRGLICPSRLRASPPAELDMYRRLETYGFSFQEDPNNWPELSRQFITTESSGCLRSVYLCPQQGWYFGDRGSLVVVTDMFQTGIHLLKLRSFPPYGIMAAWRLPSDVLCDGQCDEVDDVLGPNLLVTSVMLDSGLCTSPFPPPYGFCGSRTVQPNSRTQNIQRRLSL